MQIITKCEGWLLFVKKKKKADEQMLWNAGAELGTQRSYGKLMSLQVLDELG